MRVGEDDALAARELLLEIVEEQDPAALEEIFGLRSRLLLELVRQMARRPDLAVRMRVRAAHDLAAVLEDLDGSDAFARAEVDRLLDPGVDHPLDVGDLHLRQRQIVAGREAENPAEAGFAFRHEKPVLDPLRRRVGVKRGEIVVEHEGVRIVRVARAVGADVARAKIAVRVVSQRRRRGDRLALALPRPRHPMRRDERPFAGQRIEAAVRRLAEIELRRGFRLRLRCSGRRLSSPLAGEAWEGGRAVRMSIAFVAFA